MNRFWEVLDQMTEKEAWGKFTKSGRIDDYLAYRRQKNTAEFSEELSPEKNHQEKKKSDQNHITVK